MRKRLINILKIVVILLLILTVVGLVLVNTYWGQNKAMQILTAQITNDLGVEVHFDEMEMDLFENFSISGFYIEDKKGDTLLYVEKMKGDIRDFNRADKLVTFSKLELVEPYFNLTRANGDSTDNIQFILEQYFNKQEVDGEKKWSVAVENIRVVNGSFRRDNFNKETSPLFTPAHLELTNIDVDISDIRRTENGVAMNVHQVGFQDKSGFVVKEMSTVLQIDRSSIQFDDLEIHTPESIVVLDGHLKYPEGKYFQNFASDVDLLGRMKEGSVVNTNDIAYFIQGFEGTNETLQLSGKVVGKVNRLKGKELDIAFGKRSHFRGNMSFDGLPNLQETFINFKVRELSTDYEDIRALNFPFLGNLVAALPSKMKELKQMRFDGSFTGFIHDFVAYGNLRTALGMINSNIALIRNKTSDTYRIKGKISTPSFNLKTYLSNDQWGDVQANLKLDATGSNFRELAANLEGTIERVAYKGYLYENLQINGLLDKDLFNGELSGEDDNLGFDFKGSIDLQGHVPVYDFDLNILHANPVALQLSQLENWKNISAEIKTTMKGNNLDNLQGDAEIQHLVIETKRDSVHIDSVYFSAKTMIDGSRELKLTSREIDVNVTGTFKSKDVMPGVRSVLSDIMPSWYQKASISNKALALSCDIDIKNTKELLRVIAPGIAISDGSYISADINTMDRKFHINGKSDSIFVRGIDFLDLSLTAERFSDRAYVMLENRETVVSNKLGFKDNIFTAYMYNDSLESDLTWSTQELNTSGFFSTLTVFEGLTKGVIEFLPSDMIINEEYWSIKERYPIVFDGREMNIENFVIQSGLEKLAFFGNISENPNKKFHVDLSDFKLNHLEGLVKSDRFSVDGVVNLDASVMNLYGNPGVESTLEIDDIVLMDKALGDFKATSYWLGNKKSFNVNGKLTKDFSDILTLDGTYDPKAAVDKLNAVLTVNNLNLDIMELTQAKGISNFGGYASGALHVGGQLTEPDVTGKLYLQDARVKIDYLNTTYTFSNEVIVAKDWIGIDVVDVYDELGNIAKVRGTVGHTNYRNWNYDFMADFENLLCLNVTKGMNDMFYGKGFAQGEAFISGFGSNISVEVNAKSNKGTVISIPLGEEGEVKLENFVTFTDPRELKEERKTDLTGLDLNLNLEITREAFIRLIFDEQIGDVMEGRGNGLISMDIDSRGDFNMFGNYTIDEGEYLFTLKNIVNKRFMVEKGGTITWFGDPYEALIDIDAIYKVRASPSEFAKNNPDLTTRNVLTLCKMHLKNRLLNPDIEFEIDMPNVNPDARSIVVEKVNSELELNRQFFSLLVLNKFLPSQSSSGESGFSVVNTGVNTGFEFIANQLSNWLSQISSDVDVGVNYRPGDQISNQELAVALSTQLFNERLLVTGNLGVSEANSISGNKASLIGDFVLEYMLTEEGRLRLKVFNETNDFNIINTDQFGSTQGVGLVIYKEFDPLLDK